MAASTGLSEDTPDAHAILKAVRINEAAQNQSLRGALRTAGKSIPFRLVSAGATIRYEFSDPAQTIQLRLEEKDARLEEITGGKTEKVSPRRYDDRVRGTDISYDGALDRKALWGLLGGATATLLPVRWDEPFGMVALESLAVGTPLVAYARGGLVDVVRDGRSGVLVAPDDEKAFADGVRRSRDLHREDCRADASRYDLARMLDAHEALYRRLS